MSKDNKDFFKKKNNWSVIKDKLLSCYLAPYFQKVLITRKPIYYVDCFAGKGKFEDGKPGSPLIALQIREDCLKKTTNRHNAIETCFIDLNHADELQQNITVFNPSSDKPTVISGRFEEQIENCLRDKKGHNVFLYIDPYGIKALDSGIFEKFQTFGFHTFEMLINFNSFGFFRNACRVMNVDYKQDEAFKDIDDLVEYEPTTVSATSQSESLLTQIADGDYWKDIIREYKDKKIDGYQAEQILSTEYKQQLKKRYRYVLDMPIRLKTSHRPKYRMIHVCNHEGGCFLMAQIMQKQKDELFLNIQREGQFSVFDFDPNYTSSMEGNLLTIKDIRDKVFVSLKNSPKEIGITKFVAMFMTDHGLICEIKMIHEILNEMKIDGVIDIIREPALTFSNHKPSTFWEEKKGHTVTIRRCRI